MYLKTLKYMIVIKASELRQNLKKYLDLVATQKENIYIFRGKTFYKLTLCQIIEDKKLNDKESNDNTPR